MSKNIDDRAAAAFRNGKRFTSQNTKVRQENGSMKMYLFGNLIAETRPDGTYITNCGWFSNTTRNRLCALGVNIRKSKGSFIINEKFEWDGQWMKI